MTVRFYAIPLLVAALALGLGSGCGGSKERKAALTTTQAPPGDVECASADLILSGHTDVAYPPTPGAPSTPERAVAAEIAKLNPHLNPGMFQRAAATADTVEFVHEQNGKQVARVRVMKYGDGWTISDFQACNGLLRGQAGGTP